MITRQRQTGMSIPGMLAVLIMVGFFVMCIIRMAPPYFEYLSVKRIIASISSEYQAEKTSIRDIRRGIENQFNTNQIYLLQPREVEVYRKKGKMYIDSNYEVRLPIMGPIDAILKFDDLLYEAGQSEPMTGPAPKK
jgi:Domain of unknown function (DUF4845)